MMSSKHLKPTGGNRSASFRSIARGEPLVTNESSKNSRREQNPLLL